MDPKIPVDNSIDGARSHVEFELSGQCDDCHAVQSVNKRLRLEATYYQKLITSLNAKLLFNQQNRVRDPSAFSRLLRRSQMLVRAEKDIKRSKIEIKSLQLQVTELQNQVQRMKKRNRQSDSRRSVLPTTDQYQFVPEAGDSEENYDSDQQQDEKGKKKKKKKSATVEHDDSDDDGSQNCSSDDERGDSNDETDSNEDDDDNDDDDDCDDYNNSVDIHRRRQRVRRPAQIEHGQDDDNHETPTSCVAHRSSVGSENDAENSEEPNSRQSSGKNTPLMPRTRRISGLQQSMAAMMLKGGKISFPAVMQTHESVEEPDHEKPDPARRSAATPPSSKRPRRDASSDAKKPGVHRQ